MSIAVTHHRFTVDEYEQMIDLGVLTENNRVELINGEVVEKMSIGDLHAGRVNRSARLFGRKLGDFVVVAVQNPVRLRDSEPEPDVSILKYRADYYESSKPTVADVLLLLEVADTSLEFDRDIKMPLYARSGIREFWLLNLIDECLEVYRDPRPDGTYATALVLKRGQSIEVQALPGHVFAVSDLLGN